MVYRRLGLVLLLVLLISTPVWAQTVSSPVGFAWDASPGASNYIFLVDTLSVETPTTTVHVPLAPGPHSASVAARNPAGRTSAFSSPPLSFMVASPQLPGCSTHAITIAVQDWARTVKIGDRGWVALQLTNSLPVERLQVRFGGQVIGEQLARGGDLRDSYGMRFSVPRAAGVYALNVFAEDAAGCEAQTTAPRTVTVN